ncbi:MAG: acetate--CoA ligase family protein [Candidatus Diapherotrites archaeon]|nr:acetate--CoA ligase family protein [Candidatus Diapherotrites archaeon]
MIMDIEQSLKTCKKHRLPVAEFAIAKTPKQAVDAGKKLGYPLVLKIISQQILHKTEAGCVKVGVSGEKEVSKAFEEIEENAKKFDKKAKIEGVLLQKMSKGIELIVGGKKDEQFGHAVILGIGGTAVEVYKDYSMRICPITEQDFEEMLSEIKGKKLLEGFRGSKPINKEILKAIVLKTSEMLVSERIKELDLNPVMCNDKECTIVDARIIK